MGKKLKVILVALIVILLTLISFVGIYKKQNGVYKNVIEDYLLGSNLKGMRVVELSIDTSTKKVTYDKDGNVVEDKETNTTGITLETEEESKNEEENKEETTTVDEPVNKEEVLTEENYKEVKKILEKRLNTLNVEDYKVKLNKENGNIVVEIPEDDEADDVTSYLDSIGSFEIVDKEDGTVLLDNNDIDKAQVAYNTDTTGTTVYLTITFDKEGKKKLEDVSNKYIMITDEEDNTTKKEVTLKMEGEEILSTYFGEPITNGQIQLTVGSASTDTKQVQEYLKSAAGVSMLLNSGKMPIKYTIGTQQYVKSIVDENILSIAIYVLLGLSIISFIYIIMKNKKYGALSVIGSIAGIDILLLVIRYTNVYLAIESAVAFIVLIIANAYVMSNLVKNINNKSDKEEIAVSMKKGLLNSIDIIIVMLVISVVFTFTKMSCISNVGILMFWGIISLSISHLIFTRTILLSSNEK